MKSERSKIEAFSPEARGKGAGDRDLESPAEKIQELDKEFVLETIRKIDEMSPESAEILGEEEEKYLALLRDKDETTFVHSLEVLNMGKKKLPVFIEDLEDDGVSGEDFLRACALHDIGKINLPNCVLKGTIDWSQFAGRFFEFKKQDPAFIDKRLRKMNLLTEKQSIADLSEEEIKRMALDYRDFVSLGFLFTDEPDKLKELKKYKIDPVKTSFFEVIRAHEEESRKIIQDMKTLDDGEIVAEIAGSHHGYGHVGQESFFLSKQVLRITVLANELLHLTDVYEALRQKRPYKEGLSEMGALFLLAKEAKKGIFREEIAIRWIRDSVENLEKENYDFGKEDPEKHQFVTEFIGAGESSR